MKNPSTGHALSSTSTSTITSVFFFSVSFTNSIYLSRRLKRFHSRVELDKRGANMNGLNSAGGAIERVTGRVTTYMKQYTVLAHHN